MSKENVEIVREAIDAFNETGFGSEESLGFFDAAVVFEEPPEQPAPRVARGREAAAELFGQFDEAWEEHRSDPEEIRALDDGRVLLLSIEHFRGRDGIGIDQPCGTIFTLSDGKITRMRSFWERANALEAAGLSKS
jgi:ketosteroid isomerase-like protein